MQERYAGSAYRLMLTINTNLPSLNAQRRLSATQGGLARAIERLSSGLRVNSARDDAAGLAIATRMTSEIRSNAQIQRGINDGISLVQVAEGGLASTHGLLQRLRELAVQSANGIWSDGDRAAIDTEARQLLDEIDRIADSTQIFGRFPLKGDVIIAPQLGDIPHLNTSFPSSGSGGTFSSGVVPLAYIPTGSRNVTIDIDSLGFDDDIQLFTRDGRHLVGTPITGANPDYVWTHNSQNALITDAASVETTVMTESNGFLATAAYDATALFQGPASYSYPAGASVSVAGMNLTYSGDGDRSESGALANDGTNNDSTKRRELLTIDEASEDLLVMVVGSGQFAATASWDFVPEPSAQIPPDADATDILMSAVAGVAPEYKTIERTPADTTALGVDNVDLSTAGGAVAALAALDQAINTVSGYRARYGAYTSVFASAIDTLGVAHENLSTARSRIMDADYAAETAALAKHQILQQAGSAMLAQANQLPQQVLALLRG